MIIAHMDFGCTLRDTVKKGTARCIDFNDGNVMGVGLFAWCLVSTCPSLVLEFALWTVSMKHMMHASQCFAYKSLTCDFLWLQCAVFLRRTTVSDLCRQVVVSDPQSWFMDAVADQLMQSQLDDWSEDSQVKRLILLLLPWWLNEMSRSGTGYRPRVHLYPFQLYSGPNERTQRCLHSLYHDNGKTRSYWFCLYWGVSLSLADSSCMVVKSRYNAQSETSAVETGAGKKKTHSIFRIRIQACITEAVNQFVQQRHSLFGGPCKYQDIICKSLKKFLNAQVVVNHHQNQIQTNILPPMFATIPLPNDVQQNIFFGAARILVERLRWLQRDGPSLCVQWPHHVDPKYKVWKIRNIWVYTYVRTKLTTRHRNLLNQILLRSLKWISTPECLPPGSYRGINFGCANIAPSVVQHGKPMLFFSLVAVQTWFFFLQYHGSNNVVPTGGVRGKNRAIWKHIIV